MSGREVDVDDYVARQTATVGRSAAADPPHAAPASPIGKLEDAAGACLGLLDHYAADRYDQAAGAVAFARDGRSVLHARGDGSVHRVSLPSGALAWTTSPFDRRGSGFYAIAVSPDGHRFVTSQKSGQIRMHEMETGRLAWEVTAKDFPTPWTLSFSPDGAEIVASGSNAQVAILSAANGQLRLRMQPSGGAMVYGSAWSPKGDHIATGNQGGMVHVWDAKTGAQLAERKNHPRDINGIAWSPDGARVVAASEDNTLSIWAPFEKGPPKILEGHRNFLWSVAWSPEGKRIASGGNDGAIRIWDATSGAELAIFEFPEGFAFRLSWSPDGALLASSHTCAARLWDTRETLGAVAPARRLLASGPLPSDLAPLPGALIALLRVQRTAPLSLLRDLLALTAGRVPKPESEPLAAHPGMGALASLYWPVEARVALVLVLLRDYEDRSFVPPDGISAAELRFSLLDGLAGAPSDADAPPLPIAYLRRALDGVDDRLLALLTSLGPEACADDPTLPLALLARLDEMAPRVAVDRRLLDLRVPSTSLGAAEAKGPWLEPSGFSSTGSITAVVPSQWALPEDVRRYRAATGGLLHRARFGREPPRLRPLVLVLDVSPATFGPVEAMLRSAAHALAASLLEAQIPAYFIAAGGENAARPLVRRADLFELLTARSRKPVDTGKTLALAQDLLVVLPTNGPFSPAVVLLSHPAFGAEDIELPLPAEISGFFVSYPGHPAEPALRRRLKRVVCLGPSDEELLPLALGQVLA